MWYCRDCDEPAFAEEDRLPVNPLEETPKKTCSCSCREFLPEEAVFDTWATSSVTPLINAGYGENYDQKQRNSAHGNEKSST